MSFMQKIKCLFEQFMIVTFLGVIFFIIGLIFSFILKSLIPVDGEMIMRLFFSFYLLLSLIISIVVILHVFKIRYLDYYEIVKNVNSKEYELSNDINEEKNNNKIILEKRQEKIIIRDEADSKYKFINWLIKIVLFLIKVFVVFVGICLIISLVSEVILFVLSFLFIKTGFTFIGFIISILCIIVLNIILLSMCYNFIINRKNVWKKISIISLTCIIGLGIGMGVFILSFKDYYVTEEPNPETLVTDEIKIEMYDDIMFDSYYEIEFEESNNNDIDVFISHSKNNKILFKTYKSIYSEHEYVLNIIGDAENQQLKEYIKMINNKKIYLNNRYNIKVKTSKDNIEKIKNNQLNYMNNEYNSEISRLEKENNELKIENEKLKNDLYNYQYTEKSNH